MEARLNHTDSAVAARVAKYLISAGKVVSDSGLLAATQYLVEIRASQINGCAYCTDGPAHQGRRARRETSVRLNLVATWREATVFTEAERAALELAEQGTRIADAAGGVTDEVWANAAKHYDDDQLAALVSLIALINAWNRMNVITQQPQRLPARPVELTRATSQAVIVGSSGQTGYRASRYGNGLCRNPAAVGRYATIRSHAGCSSTA